MTPLAYFGVSAGVALIVAGIAVLRWRRIRSARRWSDVTQSVAGFVLIVWGYHIGAYCSPPGWFPLRVPEAWWWVLVAAGIVMVAGSAALDSLEAEREPGDEREPGSDGAKPSERARGNPETNSPEPGERDGV